MSKLQVRHIATKLQKLYKNRIFSIVEEHYSQSLVHQVFRNFTKCRDIKNRITIDTGF